MGRALITMNETGFKESVLKFLRAKRYLFVYPPADRSRAGVPDLILVFEGMPCAVELKMKGNKATELQRLWLWDFNQAGGSSFILTADPGRVTEPFIRSDSTELSFQCELFDDPEKKEVREFQALEHWWRFVVGTMGQKFYDQSQALME